MIFVCCQIKFLRLSDSFPIGFNCAAVPLQYTRCRASSMCLSLFWEFLGTKGFARLLEEPLHCACKGLRCSHKQVKHLVSVNSEFR